MSQLNSLLKRLNICLFSFRSVNNDEYKRLLGNFNVRILEIDKEEHCQVILESVRCNGVLIDTPTYIKSSLQTKMFMSSLEKVYPAARIRYNKNTGSMELMLLNEKNIITLKEFLETRCCDFDARKLRMHKRIPLNLNVRLFIEQEGFLKEYLCTSANVSQSGLFIINKDCDLPIGTKIRIQILELQKDNFVHGTVVRSLNWGERHFHAPGVGIRIDKLDEEVFDNYIDLVEKN